MMMCLQYIKKTAIYWYICHKEYIIWYNQYNIASTYINAYEDDVYFRHKTVNISNQ